MTGKIKTWQWLGYLGLIPFILCILLFETSLIATSWLNPQQAFIYYSAIILSFLSGALWRKNNLLNNPFAQILSNIFCLYAFIGLFIPFYYALIFLPIGYVSLLASEFLLCRGTDSSFTKSYANMRILLTIFVSALHIIALFLWF